MKNQKTQPDPWTKWFFHPSLYEDPVVLLRAKFALFLAIPGSVVGMALIAWTYHLKPESALLMSGQFKLLAFISASSIFLRWRRTIHLPTHIQVVLLTALLVHAAFLTGGLNSATMFVFPAMPVICMMVAGTATMLACTFALILAASWLLHMDQTGQVLPTVFEPSADLQLPVLIWAISLTTGMVWYFRYQLIRTMRSGQAEIVRRQTVETNLRKTEDALRKAKGIAEDSNKAKGAFLAQVSHEIRNPLTALTGAIDLLELPAATGVRGSRIELLRRSTRTLTELVDDILDFSKIEAGKLSINPVPTNPVALVEMIEDMYRPQAIDANLDLRIELDSNASISVQIDPFRVEQVLRNLVSNAIKFTPNGQITLELSYHQPSDDGPRLIFAVDDTGIGIHEDTQAHIFEPFVQADYATTAEYSGTGLGLPISSRIVHMMGGEFGFETTLGEGSRFWFSLPIVRTDSTVTTTPEPELSINTDALVVVIEDDDDNRQVLADLLRSLGMKVETAENGEAGLHLVESLQPNLVLMDIRMPGIDGIETTRRIRTREHSDGLQKVPIIALTADVEVHRVAAYTEAGMCGLLAKPVSRSNLATMLQSWINTDDPKTGPAKQDAKRD